MIHSLSSLQSWLRIRRLANVSGCILIAIVLSACERSEPKTETRLVYLAPYMPCESGDPEFGKPSCQIIRKRDAVVVLRMPKHFGGTPNLDTPRSIEGGLVLMPDKVLTTDDANYVAMEKIAYSPKFDSNGPTSIGSFTAVWGWSSPSDLGHAAARSQMAAALPFSMSGPYVETNPYFEGFKTYDKQQCLDHFARFEKNLGQVSPSSPCDSSRHYLLPNGQPDIYVSCSRPEYRNGQLFDGLGCIVFSAFELRKISGQSFYVRYSYLAAPSWLKDGHWKYIDQRLRDWIKSMDVTNQENLKGQNRVLPYKLLNAIES